jgi:hypothetical protein
MAITNYSQLQTAVANWLSRSDLTSLIPDFITLAETKFNRALRCREMEAISSLSPVNGVVALPSDFLQFRRIYLNIATPIQLEYLPPEQFYLKYPILTSGNYNPSRYFTIQGGNLYLSDTTTTNSLSVLYYQRIPDLATNTTNWLLTYNQDVYLYATLAEASNKTKNINDYQKYNALTQGVIDQLMDSDKHGKFSGSAMRVIAA